MHINAAPYVSWFCISGSHCPWTRQFLRCWCRTVHEVAQDKLRVCRTILTRRWKSRRSRCRRNCCFSPAHCIQLQIFAAFLRGPAFSAPHRQTRSRRLLPLFTCAQIIDTKYSCSQIDILHRGGIIPATCVYIICAVCWTNVLFPLPRPSVQGKRFIGGASL